ncbi:MAG: ribonuclease D [Cellvibrionaceae bacterium]|nr:ribonuclease D [Cellvibrionaceae bacterium]
MSSLVKQPIHWVDSQVVLDEWCARWQNHNLLAIDTEFMRSQTFYPKAALLQVNDGANNVLIDPTKKLDFSAFAALLFNYGIVKALHSCTEDLEVFHRLFGALPNNVFDTQTAAAALGYGYSVGYGALVKHSLNVELSKGETRSNWLQRPLSQAQINYAAIDVEYLFVIAQTFIAALKTQQRHHWVEEECASMLENFYLAQSPQLAYSRIKGAWKLDAQQLACLIALCEWREARAQFRDVPRNRVIKEVALMKLAQRKPVRLAQLHGIEGITDRMIRADGADILKTIAEACEIPEAELPQPVPHPLGGEANRSVKVLREKVTLLADSLGVAPELLAKKRDYESLLRNGDVLPKSLSGWRKNVVGDNLIVWLKQLQVSAS